MLCLCLASHYAFKPTRYLQDKHYKLLCRILLKIQSVSKMSSTAALLYLCWVRDYWLLLDTCNTHNKTLIWCNISQDSFNTFFASTQRRPPHSLRWVFHGFPLSKSQSSQVCMTNSGQQIRCLRLSVVLLLLALKGYTHPAGKLRTPVSKR